jgi:hypothetical protein
VTQDISLNFEVARSNLRETRFVEVPVPAVSDLVAGEVVLAVGDFAFTANNVTYGVLGESLSYFSFFPASEEGWGRIPAWGYGEVTVSKNDDLPVGTRVFGYFPMSTHVVMKASATKDGFADVADHRAALPPIYNRYTLAPQANADLEARLALFRPLFGTAFLLDGWLAEQRFFGARRVVLTSASSKTAFSLAAVLARRAERPRIVGLTSKINESFVRSLGVYDEVVLYDAVDSLPLEPTLSVDMAGSEPTLVGIHRRLADHLVHSCRVGASHWEQRGDFMAKQDWPGKAPEFFFAPTRAQELNARSGPAEVQAELRASLERFLADSRGGWLKIVHTHGRDIEAIYRATLEGRVPPDVGNILSLR